MKAVLGHLGCPICGAKATVHQAGGRSKKFYFRCYQDDEKGCGTIQPSRACGQKFITDNLRPLNPAEVEKAAEDAAKEVREIAKPKGESDKPKRRSFLDLLTSDE